MAGLRLPIGRLPGLGPAQARPLWRWPRPRDSLLARAGVWVGRPAPRPRDGRAADEQGGRSGRRAGRGAMRGRLWLGLAWLLLARAPGAAGTPGGPRRARSYPHLEGDVRWRRLFSSTHFFLGVDPSGRVQGTRWRHSPDSESLGAVRGPGRRLQGGWADSNNNGCSNNNKDELGPIHMVGGVDGGGEGHRSCCQLSPGSGAEKGLCGRAEVGGHWAHLQRGN